MVDSNACPRCKLSVFLIAGVYLCLVVAMARGTEDWHAGQGRGSVSLAKGEKYPIHVTYLEHVAGTGRFSVPWNTPHATAASDAQLSYLCFNTLVTEPSDKSSSEFYQRVAGDRIARWKSGEATVGE